jgi:7-cyano-7-deazaguanine synthase
MTGLLLPRMSESSGASGRDRGSADVTSSSQSDSSSQMDRNHDLTAAVLMSGGIDSAVLCVELTNRYQKVHPLFIRCGLRWEEVELAHARRFLEAVARPALESLVVLEEPIADVYGSHWSTSGHAVPDACTPDESVYLPGRNLLLIVKASVWCRLREINVLALGCLGSNPFPDSTPEFFNQLEDAISRGMNGGPRLVRPLDRDHKADVIRKGAGLPLDQTFSCIQPTDGVHCGLCNKCAERQRGFREAGVVDRTRYASRPAMLEPTPCLDVSS